MLSMIEKKSRPKTIPCINCCIISDRMVPNLRQIVWALLNKDNNKTCDTAHSIFKCTKQYYTQFHKARKHASFNYRVKNFKIKQETITSKEDFYNQISLHLILYIIIS